MNPQSSLQTLEFDRVITLIALEAKSAPGKAAVGRRRPLRTLAECENAQADLAEMVRYFHSEGLLPLAGLDDVAPLFSRETVLDLEESWHVVRAVRATQAMREALLRSDGYARLAGIAEGIPESRRAADQDEQVLHPRGQAPRRGLGGAARDPQSRASEARRRFRRRSTTS